MTPTNPQPTTKIRVTYEELERMFLHARAVVQSGACRPIDREIMRLLAMALHRRGVHATAICQIAHPDHQPWPCR